MKRTPTFLLGLALLGYCSFASAQTTPAAKPATSPVKATPRPTGVAPKHPVAAHHFIDTAAFRRSGRPVNAEPMRARLIK